MVVDKLFEEGSKANAGIFFFLFVVLGLICWLLIKMIMNQNEVREKRYIATIDKLADSFKEVATVNTNVVEMRVEMRKELGEQKQMIGRVLDRLPVKKDEKE